MAIGHSTVQVVCLEPAISEIEIECSDQISYLNSSEWVLSHAQIWLQGAEKKLLAITKSKVNWLWVMVMADGWYDDGIQLVSSDISGAGEDRRSL